MKAAIRPLPRRMAAFLRGEMARFIINRVLQILPMLLVVALMAFALSNASSGDVAEVTLRSQGIEATETVLAAARAEMGLDKPLPAQFWSWLKKACRLDFGRSFQSRKPVA